jgi:hypothetical protein
MLDNKGQIRIIEAFLAVSVMFTAAVFTTPMSPTPSLERQSSLKKLGMQILLSLDNNGTLGRLIEDEDWGGLRQTMDLALPQGIFYNMTIYDENMQKMNTQEIANTNQLGQEAVMTQHLCVTQSLDVRFYVVRLLLGWPN